MGLRGVVKELTFLLFAGLGDGIDDVGMEL
jgi:hypothetical protein